MRGKPLVVGGDPQGRGVVASASYAAHAFGVRSAMPVSRALRFCPGLIVVHHHFGDYARLSAQVMHILRETTPAVEQVSIDEAFLDVTGCERLWGPSLAIGTRIQRRIADELSLPCSVGIATNRLVAKVACDISKPRGLLLVPAGEEAAFLAPLPVERLWGVGRVTAQALRHLGIVTIGQLASCDAALLTGALGLHGLRLRETTMGRDSTPVEAARGRRSISQERTFPQDVQDESVLGAMLLAMSDDLAARLREQRLVCQTVRLKMRSSDLVTITRQATLPQPTDGAEVILEAARSLLRRHWRRGQPLRLLGLAIDGLMEGGGYQLSLFDHTDVRQIALNRAIDGIRARFGRRSLLRASMLHRTHDERGQKQDR